MVTVWSEVDPALTAYEDCTYCSVLMVLDASGFTAFPLGKQTHEERRAFRGGDTRLNFSGPVDRAAARYGITVVSPTPYTQTGLQAALATPGKAYAVAGRTANFPVGHPIRRHDPLFSGFHAVCVIPKGNGEVLWLDPLAPMGYAGDTIPAAWVTDTFCLGNYPNDARYLPTMVDDVNLKGTPIEWINNRQTTVTYATGLGLADDPTLGTRQNLATLVAGTAFAPFVKVRGISFLGSDEWYGGPITTPAVVGYLPVGGCGPLVPIETVTVEVPGPTPPPVIIEAPPSDVDTALILSEVNKLTVALNDVSRARSRAVTAKNNIKVAAGG